MYKFSEVNQSPWLIDVYNKFIPYKTNGFLVEAGIGHSFKGSDDKISEDHTKLCSSNTNDLLDLGWAGIYIDPVKEYCDESSIRNEKILSRLKIINNGCSDIEEEVKIYYGDTFRPTEQYDPKYAWLGRTIKCLPTSTILKMCNCPKHIDLMSIDTEGYGIKTLRGMNFKEHQVDLFIIEIDKIDWNETVELLLKNNYKFINKDYLNAVFFKKWPR